MIKAVIFDMDGLLIDSEPLWEKTVLGTYKQLGINITPTIHNYMKGRRSIENAQYLYEMQPWEGPTPQQVSDQIIDEVVQLVKSKGKLMPGVDHAIQVCKQASLPIAIASSSPARLIDAVVDQLKIREHFNHIYSAQFEPFGKPHPGVFIKVAQHFKVAPSNCLVFEDSLSGVLAAKAATMKCIAIPEPTQKQHPFIQIADIVLGSLEEFNSAMLKQF
jgi:HAD superfamily hydrolase (TIGR01509 family)